MSSEDEAQAAGWFAYAPIGDDGPAESEPVVDIQPGDIVRLMGEEGIDCPLWGDREGLLFSDEAEYVEAGGDPEIARDLARWARDYDATRQPSDELDLRAVDLVRRLTEAYAHEVTFVYKP